MTGKTLPPVRSPRKRRGGGEQRPNPATIAGPVYVASSLSTYRTPRYARKIAVIRALFPRADVLPARDLFAGTADWRRRWPDMLRSLAAVVFFDDGQGWIGLGVWTEVAGALDRGLPVWFLADNAQLYPFGDLWLMVVGRSPARFAAVAFPVSLEEARAMRSAHDGPVTDATTGGA